MNTTIYYPEKSVAERLYLSCACLRKWRKEGRGPKWIKLGRAVRYPAPDLEAWLAEHSA